MTKKNFQKKKTNLYLMKIQISFEFQEKSYLYLMKIQISFEFLLKNVLIVITDFEVKEKELK